MCAWRALANPVPRRQGSPQGQLGPVLLKWPAMCAHFATGDRAKLFPRHRAVLYRARVKQIRRALSFFRPDRPRIAFVLLLSFASIAGNIFKPWPVALIVDSVLQDKPLPEWLFNWREETPSKARLILTL